MNELITVDAHELITQIVKTQGECIPAVIEDVKDALLFTKAKAAMLREAINAIGHIEDAGEMAEAMIEQRDEATEAQFYMKAKLGELTIGIPKVPRIANVNTDAERPGVGKQEKLKDAGITTHSASEAERIAANKWAIEEELAEGKGTSRGPTESGILNRIREKKAAEAGNRKQGKAEERAVNARPRFVADYFNAVKIFGDELELAIAGAARDKFDPAGINFLRTRHDKIRELMNKLEELV